MGLKMAMFLLWGTLSCRIIMVSHMDSCNFGRWIDEDGFQACWTAPRIPKNQAMRQKWIEAIGKGRWESRKKLKQQEALCSAHFDEQSFNRTYACTTQTRLKDDAILTIFGYSSSDLNMTPRESLTTSRMRKTPATRCLEGELTMEFTESYTPSTNHRCYSLDSTLTSGDIVTTSQIRKTPTTPCLEGELTMECIESNTPSTNDRCYSLDSRTDQYCRYY